MKSTLLLFATIFLASPLFADLCLTRSQIEAKYGKPTMTERSAVGKDGKVHQIPVFFVEYVKDSRTVGIHYNTKGIVTAVDYAAQMATGEVDKTRKDPLYAAVAGGISYEEFSGYLKDNGLPHYTDLWDRKNAFEEISSRDYDYSHFISIRWSAADGSMAIWGTGDQDSWIISSVRIQTFEALVDYRNFRKQVEKALGYSLGPGK
jgi:hypothetical protein